MQKSILITGAAGMIGSAVVRHLNDQGQDQLILVDDLREGEKWKNLLGKRFALLISRDTLFSWLEDHGDEIEAVIHLGACSDTTETRADYLLENNYRFSIRLAEWALSQNKRFIYASSAATYGDGSQGFSDDEAGLDSLRPLNMYGYSKHLVDLWLQRQGGLKRAVGLKYFNVFGPNEYHKGKMASVVLKMTHTARKEGAISLYKSNTPRFGDGDQCRDFIYLKDAVRMTCAFLEPQYRHLGGIYNVGQGETTTWNRLVSSLFSALEQEERVHYIDMPEFLSRQYQNYTRAEMGKFRKALGAPPITPIPQAVREYVQDYLLQESRW